LGFNFSRFKLRFNLNFPVLLLVKKRIIWSPLSKPEVTLEKEAEKYLEFLGLRDRIAHKPSELSGGEQQRVAVARALINNPGVVFADEPSGNLDSESSKSLHQLFFDLRTEFDQTFVIVTHNKELAEMADRKLIIKDGLVQ